MESLSNYLISTIIKTYKQNLLYLYKATQMSEERKRVFMQPTGLTALAIAIKKVLESFYLGNSEQCRTDLQVLAITTMIPEAIEGFEGIEKETELCIKLIRCERGYTDAEAFPRRQKELAYLTKQNIKAYKMIMSELASHGITQKNLENISSNMAALDSFK
jgi:hypothetical protein